MVVGAKMRLPFLCGCVEHVLNKYAISGGRIVNKDMSYGAYQFSVLNNRRAGHECVKCRTKFFTIFFTDLCVYIRNAAIFCIQTHLEKKSIFCEVTIYKQ